MKTIERSNNSRNYGIELLRIVLMIFIIEGHYLAHTTIREIVPFLSVSWVAIWICYASNIMSISSSGCLSMGCSL